MRRRLALLAWGAAALAGCATPPPDAGLLSGRIAVQVAPTTTAPARQVSGSFELRGDAQRGQLDLLSPLGTVLLRARWEPGRADLVQGADTRRFASLDDLSVTSFGEVLPLGALFDWLRGRPWPGAAASQGGSGFEQFGWSVDTSRSADGQIVAHRAAAPAVTLRARLDAAP